MNEGNFRSPICAFTPQAKGYPVLRGRTFGDGCLTDGCGRLCQCAFGGHRLANIHRYYGLQSNLELFNGLTAWFEQ
jgi:hypothetical protein